MIAMKAATVMLVGVMLVGTACSWQQQHLTSEPMLQPSAGRCVNLAHILDPDPLIDLGVKMRPHESIQAMVASYQPQPNQVMRLKERPASGWTFGDITAGIDRGYYVTVERRHAAKLLEWYQRDSRVEFVEVEATPCEESTRGSA